jgi:hypothetical protein
VVYFPILVTQASGSDATLKQCGFQLLDSNDLQLPVVEASEEGLNYRIALKDNLAYRRPLPQMLRLWTYIYIFVRRRRTLECPQKNSVYIYMSGRTFL